jgi:hypothetical protein
MSRNFLEQALDKVMEAERIKSQKAETAKKAIAESREYMKKRKETSVELNQILRNNK